MTAPNERLAAALRAARVARAEAARDEGKEAERRAREMNAELPAAARDMLKMKGMM